MKTDGRHLTDETLAHLRKQAVHLHKQGKKILEIADITGVSRNTVGIWLTKYKAEGSKAFKNKKRGRKYGEQRTLSPDQEREVQKLIQDKTPDQLKMAFALWSRKAIKELIYRLYSVKMPIRTVGDYLKRWGFTPQRPLKKAYEQNPAKVQTWLTEEYPTIANRARLEGAEIHWGDETGMKNNSNYSRGYAPAGQTPILRQNAKRFSMSMISSVTNQGKVRFMCYDGAMNADIFINFLKRLSKDNNQKIFLIIDNLRVHHSKLVNAWLQDHKKKIELFYLPAYTPERNPDEYLNRDLKLSVANKAPVRNKEQLKRQLISHMRKIQKLPNRVKSYFKNQYVQYAAQMLSVLSPD